MLKDPETGWSNSTPVLRGYIRHHGEFLNKMGEVDSVVGPNGESNAVRATISALNSSTASTKAVANGHMGLRQLLMTSERDTYREHVMGMSQFMDADVRALSHAADLAYSELGPSHPLTTRLHDAVRDKTAFRSMFHTAWRMHDDVAFEDLMNRNNMNPDTFK